MDVSRMCRRRSNLKGQVERETEVDTQHCSRGQRIERFFFFEVQGVLDERLGVGKDP